MYTPTAENLARQWRRWRIWVGWVVLAVVFWAVQPHPQVESQSNAPLQWVSSQPAPEQQDVFVDGVLRLQFDRPLDPNLQRLAVQLEPPAAVIFDVQGDELLLKPRDPLRFSTDYTLTIAPQEGLPLEQTIQLRFRNPQRQQPQPPSGPRRIPGDRLHPGPRSAPLPSGLLDAGGGGDRPHLDCAGWRPPQQRPRSGGQLVSPP